MEEDDDDSDRIAKRTINSAKKNAKFLSNESVAASVLELLTEMLNGSGIEKDVLKRCITKGLAHTDFRLNESELCALVVCYRALHQLSIDHAVTPAQVKRIKEEKKVLKKALDP